MESWQRKRERSEKVRWTFKLIPDVKKLMRRKCTEVDYYLTQAGHECFRMYLYRLGRADTEERVYYEASDDVEHILFHCTRWNETKAVYLRETGRIFNIISMIEDLITSKEAFPVIKKAIQDIFMNKEKEERLNQRD